MDIVEDHNWMLLHPNTPRTIRCSSHDAALDIQESLGDATDLSALDDIAFRVSGDTITYMGVMLHPYNPPRSRRKGVRELALAALRGETIWRVDIAAPYLAAKTHEAVRDYLGANGLLYYKGREPDETGYIGYTTSNRNGILIIGRAYAE